MHVEILEYFSMHSAGALVVLSNLMVTWRPASPGATISSPLSLVSGAIAQWLALNPHFHVHM